MAVPLENYLNEKIEALPSTGVLKKASIAVAVGLECHPLHSLWWDPRPHGLEFKSWWEGNRIISSTSPLQTQH